MSGEKRMKRCPKCQTEKEETGFYKSKKRKDGLECWCKVCCSEKGKNYHSKNREKDNERTKEWYTNNKEKHLTTNKTWSNNNPDKVRAASKKWRDLNPDKVKELAGQWRKANPERVKANKRKWHAANSEGINQKRNRWNAEHPERVKDNALKYHYVITLEKYNEMFEKQGGMCGICGRHQSELKTSLHVDHDHQTGKIRGLLCTNCNTALGLLKENQDTLFSAQVYLACASVDNMKGVA